MEQEEREAFEARLTALETRVAYQDRLIAELDAQAYERLVALGKLEKLTGEMARKLRELSEGKEDGAPGDVRPPHW